MLTQSQPVLPLATHKYKEVACPICHFMEDLKCAKDRPCAQNHVADKSSAETDQTFNRNMQEWNRHRE
jgi:hypothetical protein